MSGPNLILMFKSIIVLLFALTLAGCGRSPSGVYQSVGSEDKFRMTLELADGGQGKFTTRSNLGNPALDQSVEASMSIPTARWTQEGPVISVVGASKEGKSLTYRFASQKNGDLIWDKNGARLVKNK
jgi:hypothetical protein